MARFIAVIDYGLGNLRSVSKALEAVGMQVKITNSTKDIVQASAIVLPGVGAFHRAMDNLKELGILPTLVKMIREGKPFLGICLGLQILFSESEEHGYHQGLDIIKGEVKQFSSKMKIPHMGWNSVHFSDNPQPAVFKNIPDGSFFYFVHSYYVVPEDKQIIAATTKYGREFVCAINKNNLWGVQFHPEKSEKLGLKFLENFCHYVS